MNMTDGLRQILVCAAFGVSLVFLAYFLSNKLYKHLKKREDKRREFVNNYFEELLKKRKPHLEDSEPVEAVGANADDAKKDVTEIQEEKND